MSLSWFKNVIYKICLKIVFIYICIKKILHLITYNGWYAVKPNQTKSYLSIRSLQYILYFILWNISFLMEVTNLFTYATSKIKLQ